MISHKQWIGGLLLFAVVLTAQAGFFSSRFDDFKELVLADQTAAASLMLRDDPKYFDQLTGAKKAFVNAFQNKLALDQFLALAQTNQDQEALALVEEKKTAFSQLAPDQIVQFDIARKSIIDRANQRLVKAKKSLDAALAGDLSTRPAWQSAATTMAQARDALSRHRAVPQFSDPQTEADKALAASISEAERKLTDNIKNALLSADPFASPSLLKNYPVPIPAVAVQNYFDAVKAQLQTASSPQLESFKQSYGSELTAEQKQTLGTLYLTGKLSGSAPIPAIQRIKETIAAEKLGFAVPRASDYVLFVSSSTPQDGDVPLTIQPISKVAGLTLPTGQAPSTVIQSDAVKDKELVIFVSVSPVTAQVIQNDKRSVQSRFKSGNRQVPNPEFAAAQRELRTAELNQQQAKTNQSNLGNDNSLGVAFLSAVSSTLSESAYSDAKAKVASTPPYIDEAIFSPYNYTTSQLRVERKYKVAYAAFDMPTHQVSQAQLDRGDAQNFVVVDDLHPADPDFARISSGTRTKADVQGFQMRPMTDQYDAIWNEIFSKLMQ